MKLFSLFVITLVIVQTSHCENDWLPKLPNIFAVVRNNLRTIGKNIRIKLSEYFSDLNNSTPTDYVDNREKYFRDNNDNVLKKLPTDRRQVRRLLEPSEWERILEESSFPKINFNDESTSTLETTTTTSTTLIPLQIPEIDPKEDPATHFTTPQLIVYYGYNVETHTILTDDGYFLTVHRIPYSKYKPKKVPEKTVLLHHGLLGSSSDWVITGPEKALAFILADAGYDVWLANARGNTYSKAHVSLKTDSFAFWNFTFHEIAQHDLPAVIDYIMDHKGWNIKINYIGHSMGTTILFSLLSTKQQYNKILRAGFALAPVAYMTDIKSPLRFLSKFANNIEFMMKLLGQNEFLPQNQIVKFLSKYLCEITHYEEAICENAMFYLCGFDPKQFNTTLMPMILGHTPAGASTKTLIHYAQEIYNGGRFQQFDYGKEGNMKQYGTPKPPEYQVTNITLPIALLSSENDWLSSDTDVTHLFVQLANPIEQYIVPLKDFNHLDFLWAIDAPTLVYNKLLHLLEEGISHYKANEIFK